MTPFSVRLPASYVSMTPLMSIRAWRHRLTIPTIGVVFAPALGLGLLSYSNGFSAVAATVVGTATAVVVLWAVATEP
jgi:hypothetical protein